jgi:hypothetical protein
MHLELFVLNLKSYVTVVSRIVATLRKENSCLMERLLDNQHVPSLSSNWTVSWHRNFSILCWCNTAYKPILNTRPQWAAGVCQYQR